MTRYKVASHKPQVASGPRRPLLTDGPLDGVAQVVLRGALLGALPLERQLLVAEQRRKLAPRLWFLIAL